MLPILRPIPICIVGGSALGTKIFQPYLRIFLLVVLCRPEVPRFHQQGGDIPGLAADKDSPKLGSHIDLDLAFLKN